MKKFYRIILLLLVLIFLSTFNPKEFDLTPKKNYTLFKIQNIIIKNNFLIKKSEVEEKLSNIYNKNIFSVKRTQLEEPLKEIIINSKMNMTQLLLKNIFLEKKFR